MPQVVAQTALVAFKAFGVKAFLVGVAKIIFVNVALGSLEFRDGAGERWVAVERD